MSKRLKPSLLLVLFLLVPLTYCDGIYRYLRFLGRLTGKYDYIELPPIPSKLRHYTKVNKFSKTYFDISQDLEIERTTDYVYDLYTTNGAPVEHGVKLDMPVLSSTNITDEYAISRTNNICIFYNNNQEVYVQLQEFIHILPDIDKLTLVYATITCAILMDKLPDETHSIELGSIGKQYEITKVNARDINESFIKELYHVSTIFFGVSAKIIITSSDDDNIILVGTERPSIDNPFIDVSDI